MADRLLPMYGGLERKRTRLFSFWCLPGRWKNAAIVVIAVLTSLAVLVLYTSPSSLNQSAPLPAVFVQQPWSQDAGPPEPVAFSARTTGKSRLSEDAEVEANTAKGYDARRRKAPRVSREGADYVYRAGAKEHDDEEMSINEPVEEDRLGEEGIPASTGVAAVDEHGTTADGQEAGPDLERGNLKEGEVAVKEIEDEGEGGSVEKQQSSTGADVEKQGYVKKMMEHTWSNYVKYAWGADELDPVHKIGKSSGIFGNSQMGATIVDSLDTLLLMNMTDEFARAREWVEKKLDFSRPKRGVSLFEFNIRFLGGLLSAYAFTKDEVFKAKAVDLADRLVPAFNTSTGLPCGSVNLNLSQNGKWKPCTTSIPLAELGSLHLEWMYLTAITGDTKYYKKVKHVRDLMQSLQKLNKGLFYTAVSISHGHFVSNVVTIGAPADSFFEYLVKSWVMTSQRDTQAADMYFKVMEAFEDILLQTTNDGLKYFAEMTNGLVHRMGHLACFAGGMLALTALNTDGEKRNHFLSLAGNITATCHESYHRTDTHIGPEVIVFDPAGTITTSGNPMYILRPETVESYFYMWRATHDPKYREWGWDAVQAIDKHCRTANGYAGVSNVYQVPVNNDNTQQSFFLAETLKYLFLLFSDDSVLPLDQWVFNTEAHPLPVLPDVPSLNT